MDIEVLCELTGNKVSVDIKVEEAYVNWQLAKELFTQYAKHLHDTSDIESAHTLVGLMHTMDRKRAEFFPFENEWWIAHKGLSLN